MITYESVCNKLGFDFLNFEIPMDIEYFEDDSQPGLFSVLNEEEMDFVGRILFKHMYEKETKVA
jgi:hypothetical protein